MAGRHADLVRARWLFFRLAILVTLVLWLPDAYILYRGPPAAGEAGTGWLSGRHEW